jgi:hypothetical protein
VGKGENTPTFPLENEGGTFMSKKKKKEAYDIAEVIKLLIEEQSHLARLSWDSPQAKAVTDDSEFRAMVTNSLRAWLEESVNNHIDVLTADYQKELCRNERLLRKADKKLGDVKYALRYERDVKDNLNKEIKSLKHDIKELKQILRQVGYYDGVANIGDSLKKVNHGYRKSISSLKRYELPVSRARIGGEL